MASVESRVVSLKFDNSQFMSGVKSTLDGLRGLKQSMSEKISSSPLSGIADSIRAIDFSSISNGASDAGNRIGIFATAAGVALGNLASKAIEAGVSMVKSFTIQPIIDGFKEYELQLNSVQTILANTASKGENIQTVNAALDELNRYADLTKYNFSEMTHNIGMFTSAGVGLKDSVSAIKGLSNVAAASGSTSQQAATAMYQLSQAISAGSVKLMDWNSIVNAGMGGEQFQEALKRTARMHGEAVDEYIEKEGSFRESLKDGWLTAEVMLDTLNQMTGDLTDEQLREMGYTDEQIAQIQQFAKAGLEAATSYKTWSDVVDASMEAVGSGWASFWRIIIGDFEQAKTLWTEVGNAVSNSIGSMFDSINGVAQAFVDLGGRAAVINTIRNIVLAVVRPIKALGQAFGDVFTGGPANMLATFAKGLEKLTSIFVLSEENAGRLRTAFAGIWSVLHIMLWPIQQIGKLFAWVANGVLSLVGILTGGATTGFLGVASAIAKGPIALDKWISSLNPIGKMIDWVNAKLAALRDWLGPKFTGAIDGAKDAFGRLKDAAGEKVSAGWDKLREKGSSFASTIAAKFSPAVDSAKGALDAFGESVKGKIESGLTSLSEKSKTVATIFGEVFSGRVMAVAPGFATAVYKIADAMHRAYEKIKEFAGEMGKAFDAKVVAWADKLAQKFSSVGSAVGAAKNAVSSVSAPNVDTSQVQAAAASAQESASTAAAQAKSKWEAFAEWLTTELPAKFNKIKQDLAPMANALKTVFGGVGKAIKEAFRIEEGDLGFAKIVNWILAGGLVAAIYKLADAFKSVKAPIGAFEELLGSLGKTLDATANRINAKALLTVAAAIAILAASMWLLATIDSDGVTNAGVAIGVVTGAVVALIKTMSGIAKDLKAGGAMALMATALISIAGGILLVALAAKLLGSLDEDEMLKALRALVVVTGALIATAKGLNGIKINPSAGLTLIAFAISLSLVGLALKILGNLSLKEALEGMALMLLISVQMIAIALLAGDMKSTSFLNLLAMAIAMQVAALVLVQLGLLPWQVALQGIIAMGAVLAEIVIASTMMNGNVAGAKTMALMAASLVLLAGSLKILGSMPWQALALGLIGLAAGLGIIIAAGFLAGKSAAGFLVLVAAIKAIGFAIIGVAALLTAITALLAAIAVVGAPAFAALAGGIVLLANTIPTIAKAVMDGLMVILQSIIDNRETIAQSIAALIIALCEALVASMPSIVAALGALLDGAIQVLVEYIPKIVAAGVDIIIALLVALGQRAPDFVNAAVNLILAFINGIASRIGDVIAAAFNLIISFIEGLANAIDTYEGRLRAAIGKLIRAIARFVVNSAKDLLKIGGDIIGGIVKGIGNAGHKIKDKIVSFCQGAWESVKSFFGIASPSKLMAEVGKNVMLGAAKGIEDNGEAFVDETVNAAKNAKDGFNRALSDGFDAEFSSFQPTIVPVVDLTEARKGLEAMSGDMVSVGARMSAALPAKPSSSEPSSQGDADRQRNVVVTQNNYSPESLNEAKIYRQTRNLVSMLQYS
jgi:tape measure domain-containing protein